MGCKTWGSSSNGKYGFWDSQGCLEGFTHPFPVKMTRLALKIAAAWMFWKMTLVLDDSNKTKLKGRRKFHMTWWFYIVILHKNWLVKREEWGWWLDCSCCLPYLILALGKLAWHFLREGGGEHGQNVITPNFMKVLSFISLERSSLQFTWPDNLLVAIFLYNWVYFTVFFLRLCKWNAGTA